MANTDNLQKFTVEVAREKGRKGGLAKKANEPRRKLIKDIVNQMLAMPVSSLNAQQKRQLAALTGYDAEDITNSVLVQVAQLKKAVKGDLAAAAYLRDTAGEKPEQRANVTMQTGEDFVLRLTGEDAHAGDGAGQTDA